MNNPIISKKHRQKLVTAILSLLFFMEGMMFYNHYSYAYQVDQAKSNLDRLEELLDRDVPEKPLGASILGIYEPSDNLVDLQLRNLTGRVVKSTERAIKNADDTNLVGKLKKAVDEIAVIQETGVSTIHSALQKIETAEINRDVEEDYHRAVEMQEKVKRATAIIQTAIANDEKFIEIDILEEDGHSNDSDEHQAEPETEKPALIPSSNPNIERINRQKIEDAKQREANRKRIKLIEEGNEAKKAQQLQNKILKDKTMKN